MQLETKRPEEVILKSDQIDFQSKLIARDNQGHYTEIKGSIHGKDIWIINTYACDIGENKYLKQMLTELKGAIESNKILVGRCNQ